MFVWLPIFFLIYFISLWHISWVSCENVSFKIILLENLWSFFLIKLRIYGVVHVMRNNFHIDFLLLSISLHFMFALYSSICWLLNLYGEVCVALSLSYHPVEYWLFWFQIQTIFFRLFYPIFMQTEQLIYFVFLLFSISLIIIIYFFL